MSSHIVQLAEDIRHVKLDDPEDKMSVDSEDKMETSVSLEVFNQAFNRAFLEKKPVELYPWNTATSIRIHNLQTGTLIMTCPLSHQAVNSVSEDSGEMETKYRTLPSRFTQQLRSNCTTDLIEVILNELSRDPNQFYIQPTWVQTLGLMEIRRFYEAFFQSILADFNLDQDNNPNNEIGLLDCMTTENGNLDLLFRAPSHHHAETTVNRIMDQLDNQFDKFAGLLIDEFMRPLSKTGRISKKRFDNFLENYTNNVGNLKIFVDEVVEQVPDLKVFLDRDQYVLVDDDIVRTQSGPVPVEEITNVIYPLHPL